MAALFVDNPLLALREALLSQKALFAAVAHAWVHGCLHLAYGDSAAELRSAALPQPHPRPSAILVNARAYRGIFAHSQAIAAAPAAQARITAATCQGLTVSALFQKAPIQLVAMADFLSRTPGRSPLVNSTPRSPIRALCAKRQDHFRSAWPGASNSSMTMRATTAMPES
jgi:hypothetical protein